jgi:gluconolactonase
MRAVIFLLVAFSAMCGYALAESPTIVSGLKSPESVVVGPGGKVYVTLIGERDKAGDGSVVIVDRDSGKITTFATGLDDPKGLVFVGDMLFVADLKKVWKIDASGNVEVFVDSEAFPRPPVYFTDIAYDGQGAFFVCDSGDRRGNKGAVYRVDSRKRVILVLVGELTEPQISIPYGLIVDDPDHFFVADYAFGYLYRFDINIGTAQRVGGGFGGAYGFARESSGALYISDWRNGRIFQLTTDFLPPRLLIEKLQAPAGISLTPNGKTLLIPDTKAGTLTWFPIR